MRVQEATAAQPALALAPPTTVVGAFTAPLMKSLGFTEGEIMKIDRGEKRARKGITERKKVLSPFFECVLEATIAASMGLHPRSRGPGIAVIMEPLRLIAAPYKVGNERRTIEKAGLRSSEFYSEAIVRALPVQAVGAAYGPSVLVDLIWVVDVEKLVRCVPDGRVKVDDIDAIGLHASYGVSRIGSKESICSTIKACYVEDPDVINVDKVFTAHTYVPADCVIPQSYELLSKVHMWDLTYKSIEYYVPLGTSLALTYPPPDDQAALPTYKLKEGCRAYHIRIDMLRKCDELKSMKSVEWAVAVASR